MSNAGGVGFQFDKTFGWAHVIATATILIGGFAAVVEVKQAVSKNTLAINYLEREQAEDKRRVSEVKAEINERFDSIDRKLDRLIERELKR